MTEWKFNPEANSWDYYVNGAIAGRVVRQGMSWIPYVGAQALPSVWLFMTGRKAVETALANATPPAIAPDATEGME